MNEPILEVLFDSPVKVRLLKLFLRNPDSIFSSSEISQKIQFKINIIAPQLEKLKTAGLIRFYRSSKDSKLSRCQNRSYGFNKNFIFYDELSNLVLKSSPASKSKMLEKIKNLGRIKLAVLTGIFLQYEGGRVDLLLVGDDIGEKKLNNFIKNLEAEAGADINSVLLTTEEFNYRYGLFDRFLRDIFEHPHEKLINKLKI